MPVASIIIPTYNRKQGGYLRRAINSSLTQTVSDIEVIVVDGGSTDDTPTLIDNYSDSRLNYIRFEEDKMTNKTRNVGIEHAEGDYISFLDSDDILTEDHIEKCVELLREEPQQCAAVCTSYDHIDGDQIVGSTTVPNGLLSKDRIYLNNMGGFSCYTVRSSALQDVNRLQETVMGADDLAFCIKLSQKFDIVGTEERLVKYSVRDENRLEGDIETRLNGHKYVLETYGDLLSDEHKANLHYLNGILLLTENINKSRAQFHNAIILDPRNLAYYYHYITALPGQRSAIAALKLKLVIFPAISNIIDKTTNFMYPN